VQLREQNLQQKRMPTTGVPPVNNNHQVDSMLLSPFMEEGWTPMLRGNHGFVAGAAAGLETANASSTTVLWAKKEAPHPRTGQSILLLL
jgi:hypothetical protein